MPRWLHYLAVATVVATLPLLFLGAEITTKKAGMSDPVGFRLPWEIVGRMLQDSGVVQFEYSHRLAGFTVGTLTIALCIGLLAFQRSNVLRALGVAALALVITQGMLGKYRVDLHALFGSHLAMTHGNLAQIVISTLVVIAFLTSRGWLEDDSDPANTSPALRRWSLMLVVLVFLQLMLGSIVRHRESVIGPRGHLLGAFLVVAAIVIVARLARASENRRVFSRSIIVLHSLIGFQLLIGIETWLSRFHVPGADLPQLQPFPVHPDLFRTVHYVVGTMILATSVVIAVKAHRRAVATAPAVIQSLEVAR